jgi:putative tricarboxylic transport membrane protein
MLMIETPHLFWFTVGNLTLANIFLLVFGLSGIRLFTKLAEAPRALLSPLILVLSVVGTYAIQNSATDVLWMLGFGVFGYFLKAYGYEVGPVVLGMILGPLMDASYRRAMISAADDPLEFLMGFGESWISAGLAAFCLLLVARAAWRSVPRRG